MHFTHENSLPHSKKRATYAILGLIDPIHAPLSKFIKFNLILRPGQKMGLHISVGIFWTEDPTSAYNIIAEL
jgi:hypothetical protein